jgi:hypothetical protein
MNFTTQYILCMCRHGEGHSSAYIAVDSVSDKLLESPISSFDRSKCQESSAKEEVKKRPGTTARDLHLING